MFGGLCGRAIGDVGDVGDCFSSRGNSYRSAMLEFWWPAGVEVGREVS